ncbi:MAG: hypothetical protein Kow001_19150 [Acidobacteriota bacterium]
MFFGRRMRGIWEAAGLIPEGRFGWRRKLPVAGTISRAVGFRKACEELGGYYRAFAVFLAGRADLVPVAFQRELEAVKPESLVPPVPLPALPSGLLGIEPVAAGLFSASYRAVYRGRVVRIECFSILPEDFDERRFRAFTQGIAWLELSPEGRAVAPDVLADFERWLVLQCDLERKRRMLETLAAHPDQGVLVVPEPVPNLQGERWFGYAVPELPLVASPPPEMYQRLAEALMEQVLILSFIPLDFSVERLTVSSEGRVAYQTWPFMASVPVQQYHALLQYVASCVADDPGRALRMLLRMTRNEGGSATETELWRSLSGLKFEVGTQASLPESAERMVDYWRALAETGARAPLFLHLFHQQVNRLAQSMPPGVDFLAVAAGVVLARLVRLRVSDSLTAARAREWMMGSSLLGAGLMRQFGVLLEQVRDNDLAITVTTETATPRVTGASATRLTGLLALFVASLGALAWPGLEAWAPYLAATAVLSGLGLMLALVRKAA